MPFSINSVEPPDGARPHGNGYTFSLPEARGVSGTGKPIGAAGYPRVEIRLDRIDATGWNWWVALTGAATYADVTNVSTWNPYKTGGAGFQTFSTGVVHRPIAGAIEQGSYLDVVIVISRLVP